MLLQISVILLAVWHQISNLAQTAMLKLLSIT